MLPVIYHRRAVGTVLRRGPRVPLGMLWLWQLKRCTFTCQRRSPRFSKVDDLPLFSQLFPISWPLLGPYFLTLFLSFIYFSQEFYQQHQIPISEQTMSIIKYQMYFKIVHWDWLVALIISKVKCVVIIYLCILESYETLWGLDHDGRWTNSELQD